MICILKLLVPSPFFRTFIFLCSIATMRVSLIRIHNEGGIEALTGAWGKDYVFEDSVSQTKVIVPSSLKI